MFVALKTAIIPSSGKITKLSGWSLFSSIVLDSHHSDDICNQQVRQ